MARIVIKLPIRIDRGSDVFVYLTDEYTRGILSHHIDGNYRIFTFYNPADEVAFILRFGNKFDEFEYFII